MTDQNRLRTLLRPYTSPDDLLGYVVVNIYDRMGMPQMDMLSWHYSMSHDPDALVAFADDGSLQKMLELGEAAGHELARKNCKRVLVFPQMLNDDQTTAFMAGLIKALKATEATYTPTSIMLFAPLYSREATERMIADALNFQADTA